MSTADLVVFFRQSEIKSVVFGCLTDFLTLGFDMQARVLCVVT